ncbi:hypothetical protein P9112_003244 [Eukaryota sp. TZLM1-RC]
MEPFLQSSLPKSLSKFRLLALVFINIGVEISWASEYSFAVPLLQSLGLSESDAGMAYLAAALLSIYFLPFIGKLSDRSHCSFGKRRPFIFVFSMTAIISALVLPSVPYFTLLSHKYRVFVCFFLIAFMDLSFKLLESLAHSIVIDVCPSHQQVTGNLWFSWSVGTGSVLGYLLASFDLFEMFPVLGSVFSSEMAAQFTIAASIFFFSMLFTICFAKEPVPSIFSSNKSIFKDITTTLKRLPKLFKTLIWIQILSWISIFAVFQFTTTFFGTEVFGGDPETSPELFTKGVKVGSLALTGGSVICLVAAPLISAIIGKDSCLFRIKLLYGLGHWLAGIGLLVATMVPLGKTQSVIAVSMLGFQTAVAFSLPFALIERIVTNDSDMGICSSLFCLAMATGQIFCTVGLSYLISITNTTSTALQVAGGVSLLVCLFIFTKIPSKLKVISGIN